MNKKQLDEILSQHKIWLDNNAEGERADLEGAYLMGANNEITLIEAIRKKLIKFLASERPLLIKSRLS